MRLESVTAVGFGPFAGDMLGFAPGMTVVSGPNESGKSSWHAAIYAALCGMRRSRGKPTIEDREFTDRYRPWRGSTWGVSADVSLDDGRVIKIDQGLGRGSRSIVTDEATGRNVTSEFERVGSVDVATLIGLSRETTLATVFVRQADMLRVLSGAGELQEFLERAAATGSLDATAEEALAKITVYKHDRIGVVRVGARGPLATATRHLHDSRSALDRAEESFESYQQLLVTKHAAEIEVSAAEAAVQEARASEKERHRQLQWQRIATAEERLRQARSLQGNIAAGPRHAGPSKDLVDSATRAIAAYEASPSAPAELEGPTAAEIATELAETPEPPEGDTTPAPAVTAGIQAWRTARERLSAHDEHQPAVTTASELSLAPMELRRLADDLEAMVPEVDQALVQEVERRRTAQTVATAPAPPGPSVPLQVSAGEPGRGRGTGPVMTGVGGVLIVVGVVLAVLGQVAPGSIVAVAGIAAVMAGITVGARDRQRLVAPPATYPPPPPPLDAELQRLEARLLLQEEANAQVRQRRHGAVARVQQRGLPVEPARLRAMASDVEAAGTARARHAEWLERRNQLVARISVTAQSLREALATGGTVVATDDDLEAAYSSYLAETQQRAEVARRAVRRPDLEARLTSRRAVESTLEQELAARAKAEEQLRDAATAAGCTAPTPDELVSRLRGWLRSTEEQAEARAQQEQSRARLDQLLDGQTIEELVAELDHLREAAGEGPPADAPVPPDRSAELRALEVRVAELRERAADLAGQVKTSEKGLLDVSAAIEAEARADAEVQHLTCLSDDLDYASHILESAQKKVHADIAPVLNETIRPWVPRITQGRYDDIRVDPATLEIQAHETAGQFREATVLSHGTTEQLFLLLRLALGKHLATTGESAPVVLDDVTVQSDTQRTTAILDLLHDLSHNRQVILFSQEDEVVRWAEEALEPPEDRLIRLGRPSTQK